MKNFLKLLALCAVFALPDAYGAAKDIRLFQKDATDAYWAEVTLSASQVVRRGADGTITIYDPAADTDAARGEALEDAVDAMADGDHIVIGTGTYLVGHSLEIHAGAVTGQGSATLVQATFGAAATAYPLMVTSGADTAAVYTGVDGLLIADFKVSTVSSCFGFAHARNITVRNIQAADVSTATRAGHFFDVVGCELVTVTGCSFAGSCNGAGVFQVDAAATGALTFQREAATTHTAFVDNTPSRMLTFSSNVSEFTVADEGGDNRIHYEIHRAGITDVTISGNTATDGRSFVRCVGAGEGTHQRISVVGNTWFSDDSNGSAKAAVAFGGDTGLRSNDCSVVGNVFTSAQDYGVWVLSSDRCTISGNVLHFTHATGTDLIGISLQAAADCVVTGNSLYFANGNLDGDAILAQTSGTTHLVTGNLLNNWDTGVTFGASTGGTVSGNDFSSVTTPFAGSGTFAYADRPDDVKDTFNPGSTTAGLNVGSVAGDPSGPANGDLWYDSTANELTARINGANVALGTGGSGAWSDAADPIVQNTTSKDVQIGGDTAVSEIRFMEGSAGGTNYTGFKAPATLAANYIYEFPANFGTNTYVLQTNGAGVLSWVAPSAASFTDIDTDYGAETVTSIWTISGNWVNTANPWADNEVSDTLTSSLFVGAGSTTTAVDLATAEVGGTLPIANGGTSATTAAAAAAALGLGTGDSPTFAGLAISAIGPTITIDADETLAISDGVNNLFTVADAGTTGNATVTGTLTVNGTSTLTGNTTVSGDITVTGGDITSGNTDTTLVIPNTGNFAVNDGTQDLFTLVDVGTTGNATVTGTLTVNGTSTFASLSVTGALTAGSLTWDDTVNTVALDLSGDRLYHDTDNDGVKDAGEEFIDHINPPRAVTAVFDGGGSAPSVGDKVYVHMPYGGTISQVTVLADVSGSAVVDVWKDTYANYPPTDADTITAAAVPTISAAIKSQDATLTGWTTAVSAGDVIAFNVDSASTATWVMVQLEISNPTE